jgi:hypothetical protein
MQPPQPAAACPPERAAQLEPDMSRDQVRRLLGDPERTEGCRLGSRAVIVWYYRLPGLQGRLESTPLVFEDGRLGGWGESYYRRRLGGAQGQKP